MVSAPCLGGKPILVIIAGVVVGIIVGAMPGLSPSTGVALLVPFSYTMSPALAVILLVSIYIASNYGGSITAVLINTPGTPAAAATAIDGFPLTLKGQAGKGLGMSLIASTLGGVFGTIILIAFAVPLARLAIRFHPADYFALAIFGLTTVGSLGRRQCRQGDGRGARRAADQHHRARPDLRRVAVHLRRRRAL